MERITERMTDCWIKTRSGKDYFNYIEIKKNKEGILDKLPNSFPRYSAEQTSDVFADPFIIRDNWIDEGNPARYYGVSGVYQTFESEKDAQTYVDLLNQKVNEEVSNLLITGEFVALAGGKLPESLERFLTEVTKSD